MFGVYGTHSIGCAHRQVEEHRFARGPNPRAPSREAPVWTLTTTAPNPVPTAVSAVNAEGVRRQCARCVVSNCLSVLTTWAEVARPRSICLITSVLSPTFWRHQRGAVQLTLTRQSRCGTRPSSRDLPKLRSPGSSAVRSTGRSLRFRYVRARDLTEALPSTARDGSFPPPGNRRSQGVIERRPTVSPGSSRYASPIGALKAS